jgi:hypothetical protein
LKKFKKYPPDAILHFSRHVERDRESSAWLIRNGYRELIATIDAVRDDKKAFQYLLGEGKHPELAAFVNAIWDDDDALRFLLDRKAFAWAACASVVNGDEKAENFLINAKRPDFVKLAFAIQKRIREDGDRNTTPVGVLKSIFNFKKMFGKDEDN